MPMGSGLENSPHQPFGMSLRSALDMRSGGLRCLPSCPGDRTPHHLLEEDSTALIEPPEEKGTAHEGKEDDIKEIMGEGLGFKLCFSF
jgi:hypothetical protein